MKDIAYEQALVRHQRRALRVLDEYSREGSCRWWIERDLLAIQRALQVYIESFIGLARYFVQRKYGLSVGQSREALDESKNRGDLVPQQHSELMKIVGFRNVLAHDYLDLNDDIVRAIAAKRQYAVLEGLATEWRHALDELPE
jgi:uncharacterized protein YutE (UPF0331/DUF86 family)